MSYGKIFESMFNGSMVGSGPVVFSVWSYVIAHTKPPGMVELNPVLLAAIIGCDAKSIQDAIAYLCAPDPDSRSPEHEGRRLVPEAQFLYSVPTWPKYREMRNEEARREYERDRKRAQRDKSRTVPDIKALSRTVPDFPLLSAQAEALSEAPSQATPPPPPSPSSGSGTVHVHASRQQSRGAAEAGKVPKELAAVRRLIGGRGEQP